MYICVLLLRRNIVVVGFGGSPFAIDGQRSIYNIDFSKALLLLLRDGDTMEKMEYRSTYK